MFNLTSFITENLPFVKNYAQKSGLSEHDSDDLAQDVLIDFCQKFHKGRVNVENKPKAYLFKLLKWRMLDKIRGHKKFADTFKCIGEDNDLDSLTEAKEDSTWKTELLISAAKHVKNKVNKRYYSLFYEQVFNGLDATQAAKKLKSTVPVAHLAKHRANKILVAAAKEILKKWNSNSLH